jgi:hypothetical protein
MTNLPVICTLTDAQRQQRRVEVLQKVTECIQELKPLDDGYVFRFAADDGILDELMQVIQLERQCCPFLRFRLTVEPNHGPVWLELTGPSGTRILLEAELGL